MPQDLATIQSLYRTIMTFLVGYSFQLFGGVVILIAGFVVARWAGNAVLRLQARRNVDVTLRQFIASTVRLLVIDVLVDPLAQAEQILQTVETQPVRLVAVGDEQLMAHLIKLESLHRLSLFMK